MPDSLFHNYLVRAIAWESDRYTLSFPNTVNIGQTLSPIYGSLFTSFKERAGAKDLSPIK